MTEVWAESDQPLSSRSAVLGRFCGMRLVGQYLIHAHLPGLLSLHFLSTAATLDLAFRITLDTYVAD